MNYNLSAPFHRASLDHADRLALVGEREALTYREAAGYARAVAAALGSAGRRGARVAILGSRSLEACLAVLGACWCGAAYVPLNLKLPPERLIGLLRESRFDAIVCDAAGETLLSPDLLDAAPERVLLTDRRGERQWPGRVIWRLNAPLDGDGPAEIDGEDLAYVEYTSGSTGAPKGVMISTGAAHAYIDHMQRQYHLTPEDRVAETSDLSFDISVSNMFMTWNAGASLHILSAKSMFNAVRCVRDRELTMWCSVPSIIPLLQRTKSLNPGSMPSLRMSFFAGEPLPAAAAEAWRDAAPNSFVDNLYGPTEATVICTAQRVERPARVTPERGIIALGRPFPHMRAAILDPDLKFTPPGVRGELALSGPQLSTGYWKQPDLTAARFPVIDGRRWYLTGDFAVQDDDGVFHHLGRIDNQVKVRGNRVELEEVEVHLRRAGDTTSAAAVAWPVEHGSALGIVGFVAGAKFAGARIIESLRKALPPYMTPTSIIELQSLPLNDNGKIDRKALLAMLASPRA